MTYGELKIILYNNNCCEHNNSKSHQVWRNINTGKYFPVFMEDEKRTCPRENLELILKRAGIERRYLNV